MLNSALWVAVIAISALGQPELTPDQCQERLEGSWEAHLSAKLSVVMEIEDENIKLYTIRDQKRSLAWTAKLVISKAVPTHHLDWRDRVSKNGPLPDNQCLYRLTGDTLLLIGGGPDRRPEKFLTGHGNEPKTMVFTRIDDGG